MRIQAKAPTRVAIVSLSLVPALALALAAPARAGTLHDPREVHLADVRQLTFEGDNAEAYWSSDGQRLIFQSTRTPYECDQIFTMPAFPKDARASKPVLVSTGRGRTTCSYFLLGDRRILYASTDAYNAQCPPKPDYSQGYVWPIDSDYEIFEADPDGGNRTRITENRAYDAEATICPKDGRVIFTSTRDGDLDLYEMNADGSDVVRITDTPGYDGGAYFSADCSQIVWRASRPQGQELEDYRKLLDQGLIRPNRLELWVANADGSEAHQVTDLGVASFAPYFFPDGKRIIFSSNYGDPNGREFDLWAINTNGTDLERITWTGGFDGFPMFSPDGKWLAFASNRNQGKPGETDIYVARWVPGSPVATVPSAADRFYADASWLADDAREGRGIGSAGIAAAGAWIEEQFREIGLQPAGPEGSYRQPFPVVVEVSSGPGTKLEIDGGAVADDAFRPLSFSGAGPVEAEVVAAGYGIVAPELNVDDYAGKDVAGKVVLVRRFVPPGDAFSDPAVERQHGAVAMLIADLPELGADQGEAPLPKLTAESVADAGIPAVALTRAVAAPLVADGGAVHRVRLAVDLERRSAETFNVLGRLDPAGVPIDDRVVVVGAHYDHLGHGGPGSLEPDSHEIHNGADDNASGVAGILGAARLLAERRSELARPVVFVAFSGEERGVLGSTFLTRHPPAGLEPDRMVAMINLDMVGRLRRRNLTVFGIATAKEWKPMVDAECDRAGLTCSEQGEGYGPSDQTPFYAAGVPVLHLFTGTHEQYHRPSDDADLLNDTGGAEVAAVAADLALEADRTAHGLTLERAAGGPPAAGDSRSFGASLGTIPDYAGPGEGQPGVLLAGVRADGPAEKAGMRRGDILVGLAGEEIRDINDFMYILRKVHPHEHSKAVIVRDGQRITLEVVFGESHRR
jgi:Tol biopolymer transport system component